MTTETIKLVSTKILTGTPMQISKQLEQVSPEQIIIVVPLEHIRTQDASVVAETVKNITSLAGSIIEVRQLKTLERIVEELVPVAPPPSHQLVIARMTAEARKTVLKNGDWLTAAEVAQIAGFSTTNPSAQPNKWKKQGLIFALRHRGIDYYPSYALDPGTGYHPFKVLATILNAFGGRKDDWGLAYWFASVNSFLGGKRPQDLLEKHPERVIAAAWDEVDAIAHG